MGRVLFVHNGPLFRGLNDRIFGLHFTNEIVERYRYLGEHVTFLMREKWLKSGVEGFSEIDTDRFAFVSVPNIVGPFAKAMHFRAADQIISTAVRGSDIVVVRLPSATSTVAIQWARRLKKPYLVECVACNWDALWNYNWKGKLGAAWYSRQQRRTIMHAPFVIYVTESFLQRRYPTNGCSTHISNVELLGLDDSVLRQRLKGIEAFAKEKRPLHVATVANVAVPYKAQDDVVRAISRLERSGIDVIYHLVGDGDSSRLGRLVRRLGIESRVVFHGAMRHTQVFEFLDGMDLYVQPSKQEGLPRALIEAMSRGLPAIGSRAGGIPELLPAQRTFRPGDIEQIKKLIAEIRVPELLRTDALRNFQKAKAFEKRKLEEKRKAFFDEFLLSSGVIR